jgi:hypothetical protein
MVHEGEGSAKLVFLKQLVDEGDRMNQFWHGPSTPEYKRGSVSWILARIAAVIALSALTAPAGNAC